MDPFDTLGIQARFDIDLAAIEKQHRELSRALHPDRYVGRPPGERRMALGKAIEVNQAWRVVRDSVARADALLRRGGIAVDESTSQAADPAFLMEIMELREALSEARGDRNLTALESLVASVRTREDALLATLTEGFANADAGQGSVERCVVPLSQLRFVRRFLDEASAAEDELT